MDLMNTRWSVWNFMISIQYLIILLDEERSSAHEYSRNTLHITSFLSFFQRDVYRRNR